VFNFWRHLGDRRVRLARKHSRIGEPSQTCGFMSEGRVIEPADLELAEAPQGNINLDIRAARMKAERQVIQLAWLKAMGPYLQQQSFSGSAVLPFTVSSKNTASTWLPDRHVTRAHVSKPTLNRKTDGELSVYRCRIAGNSAHRPRCWRCRVRLPCGSRRSSGQR